MKIVKNRQFNLYMKSAAAQFKLVQFTDKVDEERSELNYYVLVDAAKAIEGKDKAYDWKNKVVIRLGVTDMGVFLNGMRVGFDPAKNVNFKGEAKPFEIFHDRGKGTATEGQHTTAMSIAKGQSYGYMLSFRMKDNGTTLSFAVPLGDEQLVVLKLLFEEAVKLMAGFYASEQF